MDDCRRNVKVPFQPVTCFYLLVCEWIQKTGGAVATTMAIPLRRPAIAETRPRRDRRASIAIVVIGWPDGAPTAFRRKALNRTVVLQDTVIGGR